MAVKEQPNMFLLSILAVVLGSLLVLHFNKEVISKKLEQLEQKQANWSTIISQFEKTEQRTENKMQEMQSKLEQKLGDLKVRVSQNEEAFLAKMDTLKVKVEELQQQLAEANKARERKEPATSQQAKDKPMSTPNN